LTEIKPIFVVVRDHALDVGSEVAFFAEHDGVFALLHALEKLRARQGDNRGRKILSA
jgi:hypothetical protein